MDLSVAILAGGRSSRMGEDKGLVQLNGRPMIQHVIDAVADLGAETFLVSNRPQAYSRFGLRIAEDDSPGRGSLEGLRTALTAARSDYVLVVGCDMPFIQRPLVEHLVSIKRSFEALVPRYGGRLQPMLAVYGVTCLSHINRMLDQDQMKLGQVLDGVDSAIVEEDTVRKFDPDGISFRNVNTPEDLQRANRLIEEQAGATTGDSAH